MTTGIRLIALDLDGTLVGHGESEVSERLKRAVKKAQANGIEVVIATGRHFSTSRSIGETLGVDYMVTLNGGEVRNIDGSLIHRQAIDIETVEEIVKIYDTVDSHYWLVSNQAVYQRALPGDYQSHEWIKFGFDITDDRKRMELTDFFTAFETLEVTNSSETNIELNRKGTHKQAAIQYLLDERGIDVSMVMAMGDSMNDYSMIQSAGFGVAMGNAQEAVKAMADYITDSYDQDGAAKAIEKILKD
ncbi:hypothetical protein DES38_11160 [Streptohalobacillus salinus]|uniref:Cof subfamily protein (Haloacid dehalogenase superfamily)/HAD superfamily hydrolase (TIGR01484 family) n=1 Tax=Streptohalobacillus salinus TaxID=621096 RepID=A0A2V3W774_9BACI|nr:Cof-type HAD-IIB family hydrolase [Streptohalobacillus salinus]PXW89014.1 hypothetical protein DES38_11160 [Streptohalobacillus salinus]